MGEFQAAGQDVPGDGGAVGGENAGELTFAEANRGGDLLCAQVRVGQVLLDVAAGRGPVWGVGAAQPYPAAARELALQAARQAFSGEAA